jgi:quercetin dioxygenase-like cupin family protein
MADREVREVVEGEGYAVGAIDGIGEGYGFRKIRRELGVSEFGVNAVVIPAGYETGRHFHDRQQELYFVHSGRLEFEFADGSRHVLGPGGAARVDPATVRRYKNVGDGDAVCLIVGAAGGYVGRDGRAPDDEESPRGPGFEGPPGAGPPLPDERA